MHDLKTRLAFLIESNPDTYRLAYTANLLFEALEVGALVDEERETLSALLDAVNKRLFAALADEENRMRKTIEN